VDVPRSTHNRGDGQSFEVLPHCYDIRVLSFKAFLPADPAVGRAKHLVQIWTDPGGMRTLSVGSIKLKDPKQSEAARRRHAAAAG
jgi:hypothetical protein